MDETFNQRTKAHDFNNETTGHTQIGIGAVLEKDCLFA